MSSVQKLPNLEKAPINFAQLALNIPQKLTHLNHLGPDNTMYLKVIVTCLNVLPSIFRKLRVLDIPHILYEEDCWINVQKRFMKIKSQPLAFQEYVLMKESSSFTPDVDNPDWTLFKQEGIVEMKGFGRMNWLIEKFSHKFLSNGARKNVIFMEQLMEERLEAFKNRSNK